MDYRQDTISTTFYVSVLNTVSKRFLLHLLILGSSSSAANKDMMTKIFTSGYTII